MPPDAGAGESLAMGCWSGMGGPGARGAPRYPCCTPLPTPAAFCKASPPRGRLTKAPITSSSSRRTASALRSGTPPATPCQWKPCQPPKPPFSPYMAVRGKEGEDPLQRSPLLYKVYNMVNQRRTFETRRLSKSGTHPITLVPTLLTKRDPLPFASESDQVPHFGDLGTRLGPKCDWVRHFAKLRAVCKRCKNRT